MPAGCVSRDDARACVKQHSSPSTHVLTRTPTTYSRHVLSPRTHAHTMHAHSPTCLYSCDPDGSWHLRAQNTINAEQQFMTLRMQVHTLSEYYPPPLFFYSPLLDPRAFLYCPRCHAGLRSNAEFCLPLPPQSTTAPTLPLYGGPHSRRSCLSQCRHCKCTTSTTSSRSEPMFEIRWLSGVVSCRDEYIPLTCMWSHSGLSPPVHMEQSLAMINGRWIWPHIRLSTHVAEPTYGRARVRVGPHTAEPHTMASMFWLSTFRPPHISPSLLRSNSSISGKSPTSTTAGRTKPPYLSGHWKY